MKIILKLVFDMIMMATSKESGVHYKSFAKWYRGLWTPERIAPPYSHIVQLGDPCLRQISDAVHDEYINSKEINFLIDRLVQVLRKYSLVGIAAPQIGINLRVIAMEFKEELKDNFTPELYKTREMEILPLTIIVNPEIKIENYDKCKHVESCASIRGYSGEVARYKEVIVTGHDKAGKKVIHNLKGWNARICQHEVDHLNGIVFTDIMDRKTFTCTSWEAVNARQGRITMPFGPK